MMQVMDFHVSTALGAGAQAVACAQQAGMSAQSEHPFMINRVGEPMIVVYNTDIPTHFQGKDRSLALLDDALAGAPPAHAVFVALPQDRPGLIKDHHQTVTDGLRDLVGGEIFLYPQGHAAAYAALQDAAAHLDQHPDQQVLVGGLDSYLTTETLEWLDETGLLLADHNPDGFQPGEAAAFVRLSAAGTQAITKIQAVATAVEPNPEGSERICTGEGLTRVYKDLLAQSQELVTGLYSDLNGQPRRADEYGFALLRHSERFDEDIDMITPADCWGDVGAATPPLLWLLAHNAASRGMSTDTHVLTWGASMGDLRGGVLLGLQPAKREV